MFLKLKSSKFKNQNALTKKLEAIGLVGVSLFVCFCFVVLFFFPFSRGFACSCDSESIICFPVFKKKKKCTALVMLKYDDTIKFLLETARES